MRASPSARALAWTLGILDRFWGPVAVAVIAALEVFVFGPRGMTGWMIAGGVLAAGLLIGWIVGLTA